MTRSRWLLIGTTFVIGALSGLQLLAQTETFTYDDLGRLIIVDHGDNTSTNYDLDPAEFRREPDGHTRGQLGSDRL